MTVRLIGSSVTPGGTVATCALGIGVVFAAIAANHDRRHLRLPNSLVLAAAAAGLVAGLVNGRIGVSLIAAAIAAAPLLVVNLLEPHALGFGDVKFAAAAGAIVGAISLVAAPIFVVASMALTVANRTFHSDDARPLGPVLFAALIIAAIMTIVLRQREWIS